MFLANISPNVHLGAKVRLHEAVSIHDLDEVLQHIVKHLVKLLPNDGEGLLGGEGSHIQLHLVVWSGV